MSSSQQSPFGGSVPFASLGGHPGFQYGAMQGAMPPIYPGGVPHPQQVTQPHFLPQFIHPQYHHPSSMMPSPYGQLQYRAPSIPANMNQQPPQVFPEPRVPAPQPQAPPAVKNRPNREIRPGVFVFQVDVLIGEKRESFYAETDMAWAEFRNRIVRILGDPQMVELSGKIAGDGKWAILNGEEGLEGIMQRICQRAFNARTKAVGLEVKNTAVTAPSKPKSKGKRSRKDDIPPAPESDNEDSAQYTAYKQLIEETRCEAHHGHCHVTRQGGSDNHYRLSHQEMTLWAKKMSLNEATKYAPPHCLNFDNGPVYKSGRRTASTSSIPEVHVTIQNISPDGPSFVPSASTPSCTVPAATSSSSSSSQAPSLQQSAGLPQYMAPPASASIKYQPPFAASSSSIPSTPIPSTPYRTSTDAPSDSWHKPATLFHNQNVFPPLSAVMALLASERPGQYWNQLEGFLLEAGVYSSEHILLSDPLVLSFVGNMGAKQAKVLRNYAKRVVLPVLGLRGTYQEDEDSDIEGEHIISTPPTRKRRLDLVDTIVHNLSQKKAKVEPTDHALPPEPSMPMFSANDAYLWGHPSIAHFSAGDMKGDGISDEEEDELHSEDAEGELDDEEL